MYKYVHHKHLGKGSKKNNPNSHLYIQIDICEYIRICVYMYVHVTNIYTYICIYVYIYVYTNICLYQNK